MSDERHAVRDHGAVQSEVNQHRADLDIAKEIVHHAAKKVRQHAKTNKEATADAASRVGQLLSEMKPHEWQAALQQDTGGDQDGDDQGGDE